MKNVVFWDLEGPLSPMDHAWETADLFSIQTGGERKSGKELFSAMSQAIALDIENNPQSIFQAGDTLSLLVPFLKYHGVRDIDLRTVSEKARLVNGAPETIATLKKMGAEEFVLSTSYDGTSYVNSTSFIHHADRVGKSAGVDAENIYATHLDLNSLMLNRTSREKIEIAQYMILDLKDRPEILATYLTLLATKTLPDAGYGNPLEITKVMGGKRKAEKIQEIMGEDDDYSKVVVVGDSITDRDMLQLVKDRGGLAIAFNANLHALSHANAALATTDMRDIIPLIQSFWENGLESAKKFVEDDASKISISPRKEGPPVAESEKRYHLSWLGPEANLAATEAIHARSRSLVRGEAARLA